MKTNTSSIPIDSSWDNITKIAGIAAFLQLGYVMIVFLVELPLTMATDYLPLVTISDYFNLIQSDRLVAIFLMDVPMIAFLILTYFTSFGIYVVLRKKYEAYMILFTALIFIAVTMGLVTNEIFSLFHLSDLHAVASAGVQSQFEAAGEAVLASSLWNSTAGYVSGILMLGSFLIIAILMLKGSEFKKRTAFSGIISFGLDLIQHLLKLFVPLIANSILMIAGVVYIAWFIFLGLDLYRIGNKKLNEV